MTNFRRCGTCHALIWDGDPEHKCPPVWEVWNVDGGDERQWASQIHAHDAEEAAKKWGEEYDNGDYTIIGGSEETVFVARPGQEPKRFVVSAEAQAHYYARELES